MKRFLFISFAIFSLAVYGNDWVQELAIKNPLQNDTRFISVYFRFDTIINDFEVSGILYPYHSQKNGWSEYENGARIFFRSQKSGKEYVWTDWNEKCHCFKNLFMSKNVYEIVRARDFSGFKNGDSYVFHYNAQPYAYAVNPLLPYAEYQFYDADFDGELELLLGFFMGGSKSGPSYEIYDITDSELSIKIPVNDPTYFSVDANTQFDSSHKTITNFLYEGSYAWGTYGYHVDENGDLYLLYQASSEYDDQLNTISSDTTFFSL
ncbi:MAG: hypothetical protein IKX20_07180 [Paludibacteraceae bacterium]|nr:hypothetical protein [Paludibacteraceae bacterium]